jgi:hypothetical protein
MGGEGLEPTTSRMWGYIPSSHTGTPSNSPKTSQIAQPPDDSQKFKVRFSRCTDVHLS